MSHWRLNGKLHQSRGLAIGAAIRLLVQSAETAVQRLAAIGGAPRASSICRSCRVARWASLDRDWHHSAVR